MLGPVARPQGQQLFPNASAKPVNHVLDKTQQFSSCTDTCMHCPGGRQASAVSRAISPAVGAVVHELAEHSRASAAAATPHAGEERPRPRRPTALATPNPEALQRASRGCSAGHSSSAESVADRPHRPEESCGARSPRRCSPHAGEPATRQRVLGRGRPHAALEVPVGFGSVRASCQPAVSIPAASMLSALKSQLCLAGSGMAEAPHAKPMLPPR
mmetsp:Transcript_104804/g.306050  ORF Transcript_104804/g.306050 Transcript_104804/m.306050 type:complete len:215 (-) Transcript_104804:701-1345(-)